MRVTILAPFLYRNHINLVRVLLLVAYFIKSYCYYSFLLLRVRLTNLWHSE